MKIAFAALAVLLASLPGVSFAQPAPYCGPGQSPHYQFGFQSLADYLGPSMGQPTECEHPNASNGDTLQHTTAGLAFYRASTNTPTYTDGYNHFALTANGPVRWTGSSIDPPATAVANHQADLDFLNMLVPLSIQGQQTESKIKDVMNNFANGNYDVGTTEILLSAGLSEWGQFEAQLNALTPTPKYTKAYNLLHNGVTLWGRSIQEFNTGLLSGDVTHINRALTLLDDAQANYDLFQQEMSRITPG